MIKIIRIWEFHEAPIKYQKYSEYGGDEEWIVLAPYKEDNHIVDWMVEKITMCDFEKYAIEEDGEYFDLYITTH